MLIEGYWNIERVKKLDNRWLMGIFKAQTAKEGGRFFLGILTWDGYKATFRLAKTPAEIAPFLESK